MSRSNPTQNTPNPATRWFEWRGSKGVFSYYDKPTKENIEVPLPVTFIVLDRTATVRGYNKKLKTGFYSNEIRDTRDERLVVKRFSDNDVIADGLWSEIKDRVTSKSVGGKFALNLYIAYKDAGELKLGALQMTGSSMGPWFDFEKKHREGIFKKAVVVKKANKVDGDTMEYFEPVYSLTEISEETNVEALELDKELQSYFDGYFKRRTVDKVQRPDEHQAPAEPRSPEPDHEPAEPEADDVPF